MFNIEYKIGNRKVSEREWLRHIETEAMDSLKDEVLQTLTRIRCSEHGQTPRVSFRDTSEGFTAEIEGCCDAVTKRAEDALGK